MAYHLQTHDNPQGHTHCDICGKIVDTFNYVFYKEKGYHVCKPCTGNLIIPVIEEHSSELVEN